jgi:hypothetical protein
MKKQLILAIGALLVLGTAVATNRDEDGTHAAVAAATTQTVASTELSPQAAARVVSLWKDHANTAASTPLARPL